MVNISYRYNAAGTYVAIWAGKSVRKNGKVSKPNQIYLGRVINKEKNIFWTKKRGFYTFDPETQTFGEPNVADIPDSEFKTDRRTKQNPVIVDFGDSFFLNSLIEGIGYDEVLKAIPYQNRDTLKAMIFFYTLAGEANVHAQSWYHQNYVKYLFPQANISSQRISDLLRAIGTPEVRRAFTHAHIKFLMETTDEELCVLIDSTGLPNKCDIPDTRISAHGNEVNQEFRLVAVVQKKTSLPIYYESIAGNIVDISTLERTIRMLAKHDCNVEYCIGDAGYCCPSVMERLVLSGIEFMTRLNPSYSMFKKALTTYFEEMMKPEHSVRYRDRIVQVLKVPSVIGTDKDTGEEKSGFIYLCRDMQSYYSKSDHLMKSKKFASMTSEEYRKACDRLGVFAIVSTRDLAPDDVLPEYYIRQGIEQYFDFGKNYAKFLPVREHSMETISGHLLLSFIATFLITTIRNRLNILDTRYVGVPAKIVEKLTGNEEVMKVIDDHGMKYYVQQDPLLSVLKESPASLFFELRGQKADVFQNELIPSIPVRQAVDYYAAFNLESPFYVQREGLELKPVYKNQKKKLTKALAFSQKPTITDSDIESKREIVIMKAPDKEEKTIEEKPTRGPGRPKGSKNKKTLEREAEMKRLGIVAPPKRQRGRPKGSKNKKTLEREKLQKERETETKQTSILLNTPDKAEKTAEGESIQDTERSKGLKNKQTLKSEAEITHSRIVAPPKKQHNCLKNSKNEKTLE